MSCLCTREVVFAGSRAVIECDGLIARRICDFIIPPDADRGNETTQSSISFFLSANNSGNFSLFQNDELIWKGTDSGYLAEKFLSQLCWYFADRCNNGLLFHAGAVQYQENCILIPGKCGSGKTTLISWLVKEIGCKYLTDELVFFPFGEKVVQSFHRPLHLKKASLPVIQPFWDVDRIEEKYHISCQFSDLIAVPGNYSGESQIRKDTLKVILFPQYQYDSSVQWSSLTAAETSFHLMQNLVNARNLEGYGFSETTRLMNKVQGYLFTYSSFNQIYENILRVIHTEKKHT
jgi:hypothetical protein